MKKIFRILAFLVALLPLTLGTQSFDLAEAFLPMPNYTMVEILNCPSLYAIRVDLEGPSYQDSTTTIYDPNLINYSPSGTEVFYAEEEHLYYYSETSDLTYAYVYIKQYSYSSWTSVGYMHTDDPNVTLYHGDNILGKMTFNYYDIPQN
jgi:hypothetical protein